MILRRFSQHFQEQNWTAVLLDLLVVIIGIFLGLQAQSLYEKSGDRQKEQAYLMRLHSEVVQNLGFNEENFEVLLLQENFEENERLLDEVLTVFDSNGSLNQLTSRHCLAIQTASIYNDQQTYLPTLSELLASGQLSIIESEEIKAALSDYTLAHTALKQQVDQFLPKRTFLFEEYPNYVVMDRRLRDVSKADEVNHQCDFASMRDDNAFNIDLITAASRRHYFNLILAKQQESLLTVHEVLDAELGFDHETETQ